MEYNKLTKNQLIGHIRRLEAEHKAMEKRQELTNRILDALRGFGKTRGLHGARSG